MIFPKYPYLSSIQENDVCEMDDFGQKLDNLYIDPSDKIQRKDDVAILREECEALWTDELEKLEFLSDPRRAVHPVVMGTIVNISRMMVELYQGKTIEYSNGIICTVLIIN